MVKNGFGLEAYLYKELKHKETSSLAKIRMSAHKLKVETGRYLANRGNTANRACPVCTDDENAKLLGTLPFFEPIVEDEMHVLLTCPGYHDIRLSQEDKMKNLMFTDMKQAFDETKDIARYVTKIMNRRFPAPQKAIKDQEIAHTKAT